MLCRGPLVFAAKKIRFIRRSTDIIAISLFIMLCLPNIIAIKFALVKGRLVNAFCTYDYQRAAALIKTDLADKGYGRTAGKSPVYVNNFLPILFPSSDNFFADDPQNENIRFIFKDPFNSAGIDIRPNQVLPGNKTQADYSLSEDGYIITGPEEVSIDPFYRLFKQGREQIRRKKYPEAVESLKKAIGIRPYLLNYLLPKLAPEDLKWITGGIDTRTWANRISSYYLQECENIKIRERDRYLKAIIDREINDYVEALFYMSFLENISGNAQGAREWFSRVQFLESDYPRLRSWLSETPLLRSEIDMRRFLNTFDAAVLYHVSDNYTDRYRFEKFIARLLS